MGGPMGIPMGAPMGVTAAPPPPMCILNAQDASLCLQLLEGGTVASPPCTGPFGFAWSGARGTVGVTGGRYRFSVTVLEQVCFEPVFACSTLNTAARAFLHLCVCSPSADVRHT